MFIAACTLMAVVFLLVVALLLWINKNNISVEYKKVTLDNTKASLAKKRTDYKAQPTIDNNEVLLLLKKGIDYKRYCRYVAGLVIIEQITLLRKYPDLQVFYDRGYRFESLNPLVMAASDALCFD